MGSISETFAIKSLNVPVSVLSEAEMAEAKPCVEGDQAVSMDAATAGAGDKPTFLKPIMAFSFADLAEEQV